MFSQIPLFNLNAVLRETGVKPDVLRAWERRYQLPLPQRTAGRHRLYSEYDIETIKWLKARQAEGLSISRAVDLWREIASTGDPLSKELKNELNPFQIFEPTQKVIEDLRKSWLQACLAYDVKKAEEILNQAFGLYPIETVCTNVIQKGLSEIGEQWRQGIATVQQEHFTSALAFTRIQTLIAAAPNPVIDKTILIGCPPGEQHTFPMLLLNLLLRREGFKVIYLGSNVPVDHLMETINTIHPDLVILSAQQLVTAGSLAYAAEKLTENKVPIAFGGLIFTRIPALITRIAGHYLGDKLDLSITSIKNLLLLPKPVPVPEIISTEKQYLSNLFQVKRPFIEYRAFGLMQEQSVSIRNLIEINAFFGNGLETALKLGDVAFLEPDLAWVKNLMIQHYGSSALLVPYLSTYSQAIRDELGTSGSSLYGWIDKTKLQL